MRYKNNPTNLKKVHLHLAILYTKDTTKKKTLTHMS